MVATMMMGSWIFRTRSMSSMLCWAMRPIRRTACFFGVLASLGTAASAQTPPGPREVAAYTGLHRAAARGNVAEIQELIAARADPNTRDAAGRTPLHVAAFASHYDAVRALVAGGGDINATENDR